MADAPARLVPGKGTGSEESSTSKTTTDTETEKKETVDLSVIVAELKDLKERVEGQSRTIGKIASKKEEPKKEDKESATLTERIKEIEKDKEIMRKKSAREAIAKALIQHGCEVEYADKKARVAMEDLREKLQVDSEYEVSIIDNERPVSVTDYIGAYLKTEGRWLLPPKSPPNDRGSARGSRTEGSEKVELSYEDYKAGRYDVKNLHKYRIAPPPPMYGENKE